MIVPPRPAPREPEAHLPTFTARLPTIASASRSWTPRPVSTPRSEATGRHALLDRYDLSMFLSAQCGPSSRLARISRRHDVLAASPLRRSSLVDRHGDRDRRFGSSGSSRNLRTWRRSDSARVLDPALRRGAFVLAVVSARPSSLRGGLRPGADRDRSTPWRGYRLEPLGRSNARGRAAVSDPPGRGTPAARVAHRGRERAGCFVPEAVAVRAADRHERGDLERQQRAKTAGSARRDRGVLARV